MEEDVKNQGTGLGIGALVTGIIAFLLSIVPCVGIAAYLPAVIAVVLAIIGLSRQNNNQGMCIGGLVVAILAIMIATSQGVIIGKLADKSGSWACDIENAIKDIGDEIEKEFDDNNVTIRIKHDDETVEINASARSSELENKLEELEGTMDSIVVKITVDTTE